MKITLFVVLTAISLNVNSCDEQKQKEISQVTSVKSEGENLNIPKSLNVVLKKDKVYEIAYANIIKNKQEVLFKQYFPKAGPIISEYGGKNIASFNVTDLKDGGILEKPTMLVLFEWPSIQVYEKTIADPRLKELFPLRNSAFKDFGQSFVTVKEDTSITFKADKSYEFFLAWLKPNGQKSLGEYFKVSAPIKKTYGKPEPVFKANLSPISNAPKSKTVLNPQMAGIVEWDNLSDFDEMVNNPEFKAKAKPLFDKAIQRIEMIHGKVILQ
ncbi:DUF1330 domain-containing protein [uncultured Aquimarina sp.]|uniref:DUF1330 domain-containing protein n=1 Tax=uncultured Aquimarina sp. TaxID=575652 RepID=UPI00260DAB23|nr:DUF1330 domain-containing protein [uncultured Aquimarina sp.]